MSVAAREVIDIARGAAARSLVIQDMLKERGGKYSKGSDWQSHVVVDGPLITGQNPASSEPAGQAMLNLLRPAATDR